eukprot:Colp12_sorted_trinity150504_noHs@16854
MAAQQIDLMAVPPPQLQAIQNQFEQELEYLTNSFGQLKTVIAKFTEAQEALKVFTPANEGKEILIPSTGSLYVPGVLADTTKVVVDIGTGYYVEKSVKSADDYFGRKIKYINEQLHKLNLTINEKQRQLQMVAEVLAMKTQQGAPQAAQTKA